MGRTFLIEEGDWIKDPTETELQKVTGVNGNTVYLKNGGVIGKDQVEDVFLPGEVEGYN